MQREEKNFKGEDFSGLIKNFFLWRKMLILENYQGSLFNLI